MSWITRNYSHVVDLYPPRFRQRFAGEMVAVFTAMLADSRRTGFPAACGFIINELLDLPGSLVSAYMNEIRTGAGQLSALNNYDSGGGSAAVTFGSGRLPVSRGQAFLGGLPHILIGIFMGLPMLLVALGVIGSETQGGLIGSILSLGIPFFVFLIVTFYAWRRHWPIWWASWFLYWVIGIIGLLTFASQALISGDDTFNLAEGSWPVIIPLITAYLLYRFARKDKLGGVLAALPVSLLIWIPFLERNPMWLNPEGPIGTTYLAAWIPSGLVAAVILWKNHWRSAVLLALAVVALSGLIHSYTGIYYGGMLPFTEPGPNLKAAFNVFYPSFMLAVAILAGPQLARLIREIGLRCGLSGQIAYRTALLGMLVVLTGVTIQIFGEFGETWTKGSINLFINWLSAAGIFLYAAAFAYLILVAVHTGKVVPSAWLILLFWMPLGIPIAMILVPDFFYFPLPDILRVPLIMLEALWVPACIWTILNVPLGLDCPQ